MQIEQQASIFGTLLTLKKTFIDIADINSNATIQIKMQWLAKRIDKMLEDIEVGRIDWESACAEASSIVKTSRLILTGKNDELQVREATETLH